MVDGRPSQELLLATGEHALSSNFANLTALPTGVAADNATLFPVQRNRPEAEHFQPRGRKDGDLAARFSW